MLHTPENPDAAELERIARRRNPEHWVCFDCRKMFKRRALPENVASGPVRPARPRYCPECGEPMRDMGVYFEPPRKIDLAGWKRRKLLSDCGYRACSEGSKAYILHLIGNPPASFGELRRRLIHDRPGSQLTQRKRRKTIF